MMIATFSRLAVMAMVATLAGCAPLTAPPNGVSARAAAGPTQFVVSAVPAWIRYSDRAGSGAVAREQASEQDFRTLTASGLTRVVLPRQLTARDFPFAVDDVLGETVLQFECEGACEGLLISIRAPDNRGTVARQAQLAFPQLRIRNPTMYKQQLELNVDAASNGGLPFQIKLSQWRFYLWPSGR